MAFKSAGAEPRPTAPPRLTKALVWRRLPLTSTNTWSGDKPRNCAGRTSSAPSTRPGRGKLIDGIRRANTAPSSSEPVLRRVSPEITSIGDSDALAVRSWARVPVTITVSSLGASTADVSSARTGLNPTTVSKFADKIAVYSACFLSLPIPLPFESKIELQCAKFVRSIRLAGGGGQYLVMVDEVGSPLRYSLKIFINQNKYLKRISKSISTLAHSSGSTRLIPVLSAPVQPGRVPSRQTDAPITTHLAAHQIDYRGRP